MVVIFYEDETIYITATFNYHDSQISVKKIETELLFWLNAFEQSDLVYKIVVVIIM